LGAEISTLALLCAHLNGPQARAICEHVNKDGMRVQAGDKSLYTEINENGKRVDQAAAEGNVVATALKRVRVVDDPARVAEAESWNQTRAIEMVSNKQVIQICRDQRVNSPVVQNLISQAVVGHEGSATLFKKRNGIAPHIPLQDVCDITQNSIRTALTNVVGKKIVEGDLTSKEGEKCAKLWSGEFAALCEKAGITGLKPLPGKAKSFASAYHAIEAKNKKITRKQLKDELRQRAKEITRDSTSLGNTEAAGVIGVD